MDVGLKRKVLAWVLVWGVWAGALVSAEAPARHVVLVSVDGLRPEFYLDQSWPAPMMQQMAREGAHARAVRGVVPTVTYPAHTTMITGALPSRHGIYYNTPFEPGGQTGRWYWEAEAIQVTTLWELAREAGLTTASVSWPVTVGAPIDYNLPEVWSLDRQEDPVQVIRRHAHPPGLLEEIEREATGRLSAANFAIQHLTRDDRAGAAAAYLLETYRPALLAVHLVGTDQVQHRLGREGGMVRRAVAAADRAISQMVEAAERAGILGQTAFVITGDHGFVDIHTQIAPNVALVEAGLLEPAPDRGRWRAVFHTSGGSAFLHLADPADGQVVERVRDLLSSLSPGVRRLFRLVEREELERLGADPRVPLALAALPGILFHPASTGSTLRAGSGGTHGFFPEFPEIHTGFVGWGAGFKPGAVAPLLGLEDMAPLVAALLGLSWEAPDGILPRGLLAR